MRTVQKLVVGACAVAALVLASGTAVEAACSRVAVQGEALTKELAQEVTKMNLEFAVATKGAKASGPVAMKCGAPGPLLLTSCTAKQRACS